MDINKVLEQLGVQQLDESKQSDIKDKLETIVETKADEKVKEKEQELKDSLTEQYEEKFETYKNDVTEKFSSFLDEVLDEEMEIPSKIKEYARKGELYEPVIEQFKTKLGIDEGLIEDEMKDLLKECKSEITTLKEQVNELTSENMEVKKDAKELSAYAYLQEKCDGLTLKQKERVMSILENCTDKTEIDKKFDTIVESVDSEESNEDDTNLNENDGDGKQDTDNKLDESNKSNDPFDQMKSYWLNVMTESK